MEKSATPIRASSLANPYPARLGEISDVEFCTGLMLLRLKGAVSLNNGKEADYIVGADYSISYKMDGAGPFKITVPRGMLTDLVSVPRVFRTVVGRVGPHLEATIVHDYLYAAWLNHLAAGARPPRIYRRFADVLYRQSMRDAGIGLAFRTIIYASVRLFGGRAFNCRKNKESRFTDISDPEIVAQFPRAIGEALTRSCQIEGQAEA